MLLTLLPGPQDELLSTIAPMIPHNSAAADHRHGYRHQPRPREHDPLEEARRIRQRRE